jgi:hypothetical protein
MLRSIKNLEGFAVGATDGTIGHVKDLYVDDKTVFYNVALYSSKCPMRICFPV